MNIEMGMTDSYHCGGTLAEHTVEKGWAETFVFFWESVSGDKIRPQYIQRKDTKDTIVLLPEEKANICQRDRKCWRMPGACTYICDL